MSKQKENNPIKITSIKINPAKLCLQQGTGTTVSATIYPHNATNKNLIWKSSNTKIVTTSNGAIYAVSPGCATVYAYSSDDNNIIAHCFVTVIKRKIIISESVMVNYSNITLKEGEFCELSVYIYPINTTNKNILWDSTDEKIAIVNRTNGLVTAISEGKATIIATTTDGSMAYDSCIVNVLKPD